MSDPQPPPEDKRALEELAARGSGKPFDPAKELKLRELRLAEEQPLIDLGWRIDYERKGIAGHGHFVPLADLATAIATLRAAHFRKEMEVGTQAAEESLARARAEHQREPGESSLTLENLEEAAEALDPNYLPAHELKELGWSLDYERKGIVRRDNFVPLADLKAAYQVLLEAFHSGPAGIEKDTPAWHEAIQQAVDKAHAELPGRFGVYLRSVDLGNAIAALERHEANRPVPPNR
jgi:hypothetical protein